MLSATCAHNQSKSKQLLKSIIFQGMGIGFISFWISAIALLLFNLSEINSLYLGVTSCILIIIFSVFGFINAVSPRFWVAW